MKKCSYCGKEYPDNLDKCPADLQPLVTPGGVNLPPGTPRRAPTSSEELNFWQRLTFRQLAVIFIRVQAVWLFFYAVIETTYLLPYFGRVFEIVVPSGASSTLHFNIGLLLLRIALHVVAGVLWIIYAENILSWLVKDMVPRNVGDK